MKSVTGDGVRSNVTFAPGSKPWPARKRLPELQPISTSPYALCTFSSAVMMVPHGVTVPEQSDWMPTTTPAGSAVPTSS